MFARFHPCQRYRAGLCVRGAMAVTRQGQSDFQSGQRPRIFCAASDFGGFKTHRAKTQDTCGAPTPRRLCIAASRCNAGGPSFGLVSAAIFFGYDHSRCPALAARGRICPIAVSSLRDWLIYQPMWQPRARSTRSSRQR